jgi:hypothetical protein
MSWRVKTFPFQGSQFRVLDSRFEFLTGSRLKDQLAKETASFLAEQAKAKK